MEFLNARKLVSAIALFALSGLLTVAHAELVDFSYTSSEGEAVTVDPDSRVWINPVSEMTFNLSGGLQRRVGVRIYNEQGDEVASVTSGQIGAEDEITSGGDTFYGKQVALDAPAEDGVYVFQAALMDLGGATLDTTNYQFRIDREKPYNKEPLGGSGDNLMVGNQTSDATVSINGGEPQPLQYAPTAFSEESYAYADASATGLPQYARISWIKIAVKDGKLYYINVHDKQHTNSGGKYNLDLDGLPSSAETVVADDNSSEFSVGRNSNQGNWSWADCCTDGGVFSVPVGDMEEGLEFTATYSGAQHLDTLRILNNQMEPYEVPPNSTLTFRFGADQEENHGPILKSWKYVTPPDAAPYYEVVIRDRYAEPYDGWSMDSANLVLQGRSMGATDRHVIQPNAVEPGDDGLHYTYRYDPVDGLQTSGHYDVVVEAADNMDHAETFELEGRSFDVDDPTITFLKDGQPMEGGESLFLLGELAVQVADPFDDEVSIESARIVGGPDEQDLRLASRETQGGRFQLEYPVLPPSLEDDDTYEVTVTATDSSENATTESLTFSYDPALVDLGAFAIPHTPDGSVPWEIKSGELKNSNGAPLEGTMDVQVSLREIAEGPIELAGHELAPGDSVVLPDVDFSDLRFETPVRAGMDAPAGARPILLQIVGPTAPTVMATVNTWKAGAAMQSSTAWEPVSFMEDTDVAISAAQGTVCALTHDAQQARSSTNNLGVLQDAPKCLVEWTQKPAEMSAYTDSDSGQIGIAGRVVETAETPVSYRISVFDAAGQRVTLAEGEKTYTPLEPKVAFGIEGGVPDEVGQLYESVELEFEQDAGLDCAATASRNAAITSAKEGEPACLVEWTAWPKNLAPVSGAGETRSLSGYIPRKGEKSVGWKTSLFAADGTEYVLEEANRTFETIAPRFEFVAEQNPDGVYRQIETAELVLGMETTGAECSVNTISGEIDPGAFAPNETCIVRFDEIPEGMYADYFASTPRLSGRVPTDGAKNVVWSVYGLSATEEVIKVGEDSLTFDVTNPPKPSLSLVNTDRLKDESIPVRVSGSQFGTAEANAPVGELELLVEGLEEGPLKVRGGQSYDRDSQSRVNLIMRGAADELWEHQSLTVTARYAELPGISRSEKIEIYGIPADRIGAYLFADREAINTDDVEVRMELGSRVAGEVEYEAAKMGEWSAEIGASTRSEVDGGTVETFDADTASGMEMVEAETADGDKVYLDGRMAEVLGENETRLIRAIAPVTEVTELDKGLAEFAVPPGEESARMLKGVATLKSPDGLYRQRIESNQIYVQILEGYPLDPEVLARRTSGPAPYRTIINLRLDQMERQAVGKVEWLARQGEEDEWETVRADTGLTRFDHTFEAGEHQVRARLHNRNTGATSETQIVQINAYRELDVEVAGGNRTFPGTPLELEAVTTLGGEPFEDATIEWQIEGETVGTGRTFSLERDAPTGVRLNVRARAPEAPADDRYAWSEERHSVRVSRPRPLRVRIDGPRTVDFEETATFRTDARMPYSSMNEEQFPMRGEWVLPDGSTVDGKTVEWENRRGQIVQGTALDYSPTVDDRDESLAEIGYRSWIEGYRDETERTQTKRVRVTHYVWPDFNIQVQRTVKFAPSSMTLIVRTPGFYGRLDDPEYEWHLPESATEVRANGARAALTLTEAGTFDIGVTVSDARGNKSAVTVPVEAIEAEPFDLSGDLRFSNEYRRAPLDLYGRFRADGGHPRDRTDTFTYRIDGEPVQEPSADRSIRLQGLKAGEHTFEVAMQSEMGATARWSRTIEVYENQPPVCEGVEVEYRETGPYYILEANCADDDGRITGYRWDHQLREEPRVTTNRFVIRDDRESPSAPIELSVTAIDDAGGETTMTRTLSPQ